MKNLNKTLVIVLLVSLVIGACTLPAMNPTSTDSSDSAVTGHEVASEAPVVITTPTWTPAVAPIQDCNPIVTTTTVANVRGGPGTNYNIVGSIPLGGTAPVAGKSQDGTWWYIQFPGGAGGYAWIAGSVTTAACIPATLPVIAAPAAPPADNSEPEVSEEPTEPPASDFELLQFNEVEIFKYVSPTPTWVIPNLEIQEIEVPDWTFP